MQQTRIDQGMAYWERFVAAYPTVHHLAQVTEDEVLRLWQGLGYYSRARHLLEAARQVDALGDFPRTREGLLGLSGVGDYTAAAIGSICYDLPLAVVDGNVFRVLSRHYGIDTPIDTTAGRRVFERLAAQLLPPSQRGDYNQGLMDFGALCCTPRQPHCVGCPLAETCQALRQGTVDGLPRRQGRPTKTEVSINYIYIRCGGYTALRRRPAGDIWQGLWEPLNLSAYPDSLPPDAEPISVASLRHVLTHRVVTAHLLLLVTDHRPPLPDDYEWVEEADLQRYATSRLVQKLLAHI